MKRHVRLGYEITEGQDIEDAIQNLSGTHIAHLEPNRENGLYIIMHISKIIIFFLYIYIYFQKQVVIRKNLEQ
jgi:hypothetical protein